MYYTLKDMAQLAGMNERTVLLYMQGTRRAHAAPTAERRSWQFTEDDLTALREMKLHAEQERTRTAHAAYTQSTDGGLAARVAALEATIEHLRKRAPYLFAETRHSAPQVPAVELPVYDPPRRLAATTASHTTHGARQAIPAGWVHQNQWAADHHMASTTVKRHIKDEGIPLEHGDWIEGTTPVKHLLAEEGQAQLHRHFRLGDPCTICGWSSKRELPTTGGGVVGSYELEHDNEQND